MSVFKKKNKTSPIFEEPIEKEIENSSIIQVQSDIMRELDDPNQKLNLRLSENQITREEIFDKYTKLCKEKGLTEEETDDILEIVDRSVFGYGLIHDLLVNEPDISDVRLIDENRITYMKKGKRYLSPLKFASKDSYIRFVEQICSRNKINLSVSQAAQIFTDAEKCLTHILRFTVESAIINQTTLPSVVIRKTPKVTPTWEKLIEDGLFTEDQKNIVTQLWRNGFSVLISGPNGSGKTTVMNQILNYATPQNRATCVIQESEGELHANPKEHPEMVFKKIIPATANSKVSYDLKTITQLALTESFDSIVVGEVKGGEAAQLANAVWTGSQSMTSTHANSIKDAKKRLVQLACDENPSRSPEFFMEQLSNFRVNIYVKKYKIIEITVDDEPFSWDKFNNHQYDFHN